MPSTFVVCLIVLCLTASLIAVPPATKPAATVTRDLVYAKAGGVSLRLDACVPDSPGPHPAVVLVHGGAWQHGDKTHFRSLFDPLTRAGYAWFSVNYRLAPRFSVPEAADDVEAAVAWVKANAGRFGIDPMRVALLGESAGGHLVELVAARSAADAPGRPAAVVALYAPSDLTNLTEHATRKGLPVAALLKTLFGRSELDAAAKALLIEASPLTHVKAGLPPFFLMHGTADQIVPVGQSVAFQAACRAVGVPCELVTVKNGPHGMMLWNLIDPGYRDKILAFLDAHLRGRPGTP